MKRTPKVPLIIGSKGRKLYGLVAEFFKVSNRWMIQDSAENYSKLINEYKTETDEVKKAKKLLDLTWLSEFNEAQGCNVISKELEQRISSKQIYADEYKNRSDLMNRAGSRVEVENLEQLAASSNPEDALIDYIDAKIKLERKTNKITKACKK